MRTVKYSFKDEVKVVVKKYFPNATTKFFQTQTEKDVIEAYEQFVIPVLDIDADVYEFKAEIGQTMLQGCVANNEFEITVYCLAFNSELKPYDNGNYENYDLERLQDFVDYHCELSEDDIYDVTEE